MATASVTYQPAAGRAYIDLTSWAGSIGATTTPVAGDQIEAPDTLTLNAGSSPTGADGTYTLRHIQAANGTTEAVSYTITTADTTEPTLTSPAATVTGSTTLDASVSTDEANGTLYTLASANATETEATVKSSGQSQAVSATGAQSVSITELTASTPYYVHFMHEDAATNQSTVATSTQVTTDAAPTASSAIATVAYEAPTGKTAVTLATGFDDYIFQEWATQPVVGEQIVFTDSEITVDELANVTTDTEAVFDIWFVELNGTVTATTVDSTGLNSVVTQAPQSAPTIGTITKDATSASIPFGTVADATSYEHSTDGGSTWSTVTSPISRTGLTAETSYSGQVRAVNSVGSGPDASYGFTTDAVPAVPAGETTFSFPQTTQTTVSVQYQYSAADQTGFEYSLDGGAWTATGKLVQISGLTGETTYNLAVRAVNGVGNGVAYDVNFRTKGEPATPSEDNWPFSKRIKNAAPKIWSWGKRHPMTNMRVRMKK